jgi:hypothetical protein
MNQGSETQEMAEAGEIPIYDEFEKQSWHRRRALAVPEPRRLEPTLMHRYHRMNPVEKLEIRRWLRCMTLRKSIRAILAQAQLAPSLTPACSAPSPTQELLHELSENSHEHLMKARDSALKYLQQST